ncbi:MAG: alpha/beta hydrolase [Oscillospiraceae bacterium]|jgi:pimeloyl-ACP methyl ester carboxylesterase|nr:alpha/beta hydrolase [Oscillospiraceae bacterium]
MTVNINHQPIYYEERGEGPAVLLLHGWGVDCSLFRPLMQLLSKQYRALALDFPGFGQSPEPPEPWCVDHYADLALAFLQALGISSCILLGHSFGGRVAIKLCARQLPSPVFPKVILVDAAGVKPTPTKQAVRRAKRYQIGKQLLTPFPKLMERWRDRHGSADYKAASPMMREVLKRTVSEDLTPLFPLVKPPVLLIWGRGDTATPLSDGQLMERQMPNAGLAVLEQAGHFSFLEQQPQFLRVIASFLRIEP